MTCYLSLSFNSKYNFPRDIFLILESFGGVLFNFQNFQTFLGIWLLLTPNLIHYCHKIYSIIFQNLKWIKILGEYFICTCKVRIFCSYWVHYSTNVIRSSWYKVLFISSILTVNFCSVHFCFTYLKLCYEAWTSMIITSPWQLDTFH